MNTIAMNTLNGAVTEYDWTFQSITPNWAGNSSGLYALGGDTDNGAVIIPDIMAGEILMGNAMKSRIDNIWYSVSSPGVTAIAALESRGSSYAYNIDVRAAGVSRVEPGKGLYVNYLAVGYTNTDGADFRIDRMELDVKTSTTRRIGA